MGGQICKMFKTSNLVGIVLGRRTYTLQMRSPKVKGHQQGQCQTFHFVRLDWNLLTVLQNIRGTIERVKTLCWGYHNYIIMNV